MTTNARWLVLVSLALAAVASRTAIATPAPESEGSSDAEAQRFAFSDGDLDEVKPDEGVAAARVTGKPSWCDHAGRFDESETWATGRIHRTFSASNGIGGVIEAALHICQRPNDRTWRIEAGYIVQKWMNWTRLSQSDAEKALAARVQTAQFAAQREQLCKALEVSPEIGGQDKAYSVARLELFGCRNDNQTLWQDASSLNPTTVGYYLDGDTQTDELMRAYWLFGTVRGPLPTSLPANDAASNLPLLYHAIARADFAHLDATSIDKLLMAAPYNEYARIVALETLGVLKARQRAYDQALERMTRDDEDYTAILRTAPANAFAQWEKMAERWKPEIERSSAFEKLLSRPSRKALKGCSPTLQKDGARIVQSFKTTDYKELVDKISADPVASLVLGRIAVCYAADSVWGASGALRELVLTGRTMRGPRSLAYYAVVDAIAAARKDRPRLLLSLDGFFENGSVLTGGFEPPGKDLDWTGALPNEWERSDNKGVVASTSKVEDGLQIVFKKVTLKYADMACSDDTRHPLKINSSGRIEYYRNCKALGTFSKQDMTPPSIVISPLLDAGVRSGMFVRFAPIATRAKNGNAFAGIVYTKKTAEDKKLTSFLGFAL